MKIYTSVASILIESALPFSILGIVYGVYVGNGQAPQVALGIIWGSFFVSLVSVRGSRIKVSLIASQALSPQLIILRVAMGRAWSSKTSSMFTMPTIVAGKDSHVKTTLNFDSEESQGKSRTASDESVGESKNSPVIFGNSFTDMNVRA